MGLHPQHIVLVICCSHPGVYTEFFVLAYALQFLLGLVKKLCRIGSIVFN